MRTRQEIKDDILETTFNVLSDIERGDDESLAEDKEILRSLHAEKEIFDQQTINQIVGK